MTEWHRAEKVQIRRQSVGRILYYLLSPSHLINFYDILWRNGDDSNGTPVFCTMRQNINKKK